MANIEIQRKQPHAVWWILGLILLTLLLVWLFAGRNREGIVGGALGDDTLGIAAPPATTPLPGTAVGASADGAVADYLTHVRGEGDFSDMGRAHAYTSTGLRLLASAIEQVARADTTGRASVEARLTTLRERAEALQRDPSSPQHARMTRDAFTAAADAMRELQRVRFPAAAGEVERARSAAEALSASRPLLEQRDAAHAFFQRAGDALQRMRAGARS